MKKMKNYAILASILLMLAATLTSCEKFALEDSGNGSKHDANANVTIHVQQVQDIVLDDLSRSGNGVTLDEICSRLSFVVFDGEEKIETTHQTNEDSDFGTCRFNLDEGEYRLVVIAHNGKGNCTMSLPEKVKFSSNKLTDTFYYYGRLSVDDKGAKADIKLQRAVSAFKLHINDKTLTSEVKSIKFYYTGGSSTLDATTGYGNVNSRQTETFNITGDNRDFEVFTFPHEDGKTINMTISILDADAKAIKTYQKSDIKMLRNEITKTSISIDGTSEGTGDSGSGGSTIGINFTIDDDWGEENVVYF